ncbi:uncharacterized protein LOC122067988 [Macadamia integrifolia]|uniref:uncharacterized protein LOC122067988 n=1 Tax=Macadamia integrifolia TaxID=60698 RepID=UPI001C50009D|nr:uncharacterized protein LOC122067988 [Macadamia integrifolia]
MEGMGSDGSGELQCVGKLEIVPPKPVGFLCGTLPVPTDNAFHHAFNSEIVPSSETVSAPRYRMLPTETDLNTPPLLSHLPDKVLPVDAVRFKTGGGDLHWDTGPVSQNLARKCEALAVSGLAEYGDEIDVVAPADIVKQIFKMPYSKAQLSIAVHRIGQTLVLNTGPDVEEGEKLVRRHNNQAKCADQSLFLNFAMHSVRVEACDCPPSKNVPSEEQADSTILPGQYESRKGSFVSSDSPAQSDGSQYLGQSADGCQKARLRHCTKYSNVNPDDFVWASKRNKRNNRRDAVEKTSQVGEKPRCIVQESDKYRRIGNDGFLRALFWQFHNFRMLLGSDLLLFSNEKYVAVSLHLWDVARQVTPLTWLEAWLDNVMASVPELAICYHQNGVVQGYELLKTDDIFLLKGISEDGTPAFNPHVVQQNGHSVFRFLQDNCKQDPGAYWLYKSAGEDVIHLFDLSVIPENHSTDAHDNSSSGLPSLMHRRRRDSLFSLGTLLSRVAHRLSLSMTPNGRAKCARLFKKCFEFLDKQDHLVVRAFAHEQFARLILKCYEELDLTLESLPLESEVTVTDAEGESSDYSLSVAGSIGHDKLSSQGAEKIPSTNDAKIAQELVAGMASPKLNLEANVSASGKILASESTEKGKTSRDLMDSEKEDSLVICQGPTTNSHVIQTIADPISSRLAAIHHVSQAIKSLRWKRQLQSTEEEELMDHGIRTQDRSSAVHLTVCACGDPDCIEVCDIREWLPKSKMDHKLWKLVLLLGESYLALGEAYKENGQLNQTLKVVELACSVYGSVPQHLEDAQFISSIIISSSSHSKFNGVSGKTKPFLDDKTNSDSGCSDNSFTTEQLSSSYLFWAKAWTLVGDVYVEYHMTRGKEIYLQSDGQARNSELRMSSEVLKEVKRLKKKLGQYKQNCSTCSLINCSCQSDRASSGNSASSSSGVTRPLAYGRKQSKRSNLKNSLSSLFKYSEDDLVHPKAEIGNDFQGGCPTSDRGGESGETLIQALHAADELGGTYVASNSGQSKGTSGMPNTDSTAAAGSGPREASKEKTGGIFKFLEGPVVGDIEYNLSSAISCYDTARKAIPTSSSELQSILKKKGWACNELGRCRLESKNLDKAELAFADAINAFNEVSDHTNIILINCNLGHGRRALAEEMVFKLENLRTHALWKSACNQAVAAAKQEYSASLRYYGAARAELNAIGEGAGSVSSSLRDEVNTQFAHTYLRLGMLLAREDISAEIYENGVPDDLPIVYVSPSDRRPTKELRKREISANDAIREALCMYDSLGELRKQEAAYAYFQLACYHRDCCLKFLDSNQKQINPSRSESILQKVKQYASLAERNWQKSIDFYGPKTHPTMHVTILMERSALSLSLSYYFQSNMMLESALSRLLEGHHVFGEPGPDSLSSNFSEVCAKLWSQLQLLLKRMLTVARSGSTNKSCLSQAAPTNSRSGDIGKLKELYRMSLKSTEMNQLCAMYELWMS